MKRKALASGEQRDRLCRVPGCGHYKTSSLCYHCKCGKCNCSRVLPSRVRVKARCSACKHGECAQSGGGGADGVPVGEAEREPMMVDPPSPAPLVPRLEASTCAPFSIGSALISAPRGTQVAWGGSGVLGALSGFTYQQGLEGSPPSFLPGMAFSPAPNHHRFQIPTHPSAERHLVGPLATPMVACAMPHPSLQESTTVPTDDLLSTRGSEALRVTDEAVGRTYAMGLPTPITIRVELVRRDPASPTHFVMRCGDAEAKESAEAAILGALVSYEAFLQEFVARRKEATEACPDVWAVLQHLCFEVSCFGGVPEGGSLGLAVGVAALSVLGRVNLKPHFGFTGEVRLSGELAHVKLVPEKICAARTFGLHAFAVPKGNCSYETGLHACEELPQATGYSVTMSKDDMSWLARPAWDGLEGTAHGQAGVEGHGRSLWFGEAEALVFCQRGADKRSERQQQQQQPPEQQPTELVAAGGGAAAAAETQQEETAADLLARAQRVEVVVCKGTGNVSVVGGDAVGGKDAVLAARRYLGQHWSRIPGLRSGGLEELDVFVSFPDRDGVKLGGSEGLEGAILVATVGALLGRGRKAGTRGVPIWAPLYGAGTVFDGGAEQVVLTPGAAQAIGALAASPGVNKVVLPKRIAEKCVEGRDDANDDKFAGVTSADDLLSVVLGIELQPLARYRRVEITGVRVATVPQTLTDNAESSSPASSQVVDTATVQVFTPDPDSVELHVSLLSTKAVEVIRVQADDVQLALGTGSEMSTMTVKLHCGERVLMKPEQGQDGPWCCLVSYVQAALEWPHRGAYSVATIEIDVGICQDKERVRCGLMLPLAEENKQRQDRLYKEIAEKFGAMPPAQPQLPAHLQALLNPSNKRPAFKITF